MEHDSRLCRTIAARAGILLTVSALAVGALAGCVPEPNAEPTGNPGVSAPPSTSPTIPVPTQTATPSEPPTPVSIPCASVVSAQTMYDFNPNFGLLANFSPDGGTLAASAAMNHGTVCRWINQTSGITIDVSISQPGKVAFAAAKADAESGAPVSGLGDTAYFATSGGNGEVQAFRGPLWITATSAAFLSASDAATIMDAAVAAAP